MIIQNFNAEDKNGLNFEVIDDPTGFWEEGDEDESENSLGTSR